MDHKSFRISGISTKHASDKFRENIFIMHQVSLHILDPIWHCRVGERVGKAGDSDQGQPLHVEMEQMTNVVC